MELRCLRLAGVNIHYPPPLPVLQQYLSSTPPTRSRLWNQPQIPCSMMPPPPTSNRHRNRVQPPRATVPPTLESLDPPPSLLTCNRLWNQAQPPRATMTWPYLPLELVSILTLETQVGR